MIDSTLTSAGINQIQETDRGIHDWYRFVLSFPPHLVRHYLDDFNARPGQTVLDPFCGTGTTLVEARKLGFACAGIEANPMAYFACKVKTQWNIALEDFEQHSQEIARQASAMLSAHGFDYSDLPLFARPDATVSNLRHLSREQARLLLSGSISPRPLHRALVLLELIRASAKPWTCHQELAFAATLVADASNLKFGPEVGINRKPREDADVVGCWMGRVRQMAADLRTLPDRSYRPVTLFHGDARNALPFEKSSVDFVITSPPYPNEKDYTRTTRLESVVLGFINSRQELQAIKKKLLRSNTRNVYVDDQDDRWVRQFASIQQLAGQIEAKRLELGKTSGFERLYHRVVSLYFGGMYRHLEALKYVLSPGALCAYVVGDQESYFRITIRTGQLLAEIAEYCGYEIERIDLWRTRPATATGAQIREEVVILRWPG
ncbi:MAG: DNA methyltransferase [Anaerolineae bacterium]|nr:DNA methyltransferase [Anaerolineae bacterium]